MRREEKPSGNSGEGKERQEGIILLSGWYYQVRVRAAKEEEEKDVKEMEKELDEEKCGDLAVVPFQSGLE